MKHKFSSSPFFCSFFAHNFLALQLFLWVYLSAMGWGETSTLCNLSKSDEMMLSSLKFWTTQTHQLFDDSVREKFSSRVISEQNFHMKNCVWTLNIQLHADDTAQLPPPRRNFISFTFSLRIEGNFFHFTFTTCCH